MSQLSVIGLGLAIVGVSVQRFGQALIGNVLIAVGGALVILGAVI